MIDVIDNDVFNKIIINLPINDIGSLCCISKYMYVKLWPLLSRLFTLYNGIRTTILSAIKSNLEDETFKTKLVFIKQHVKISIISSFPKGYKLTVEQKNHKKQVVKCSTHFTHPIELITTISKQCKTDSEYMVVFFFAEETKLKYIM